MNIGPIALLSPLCIITLAGIIKCSNVSMYRQSSVKTPSWKHFKKIPYFTFSYKKTHLLKGVVNMKLAHGYKANL